MIHLIHENFELKNLNSGRKEGMNRSISWLIYNGKKHTFDNKRSNSNVLCKIICKGGFFSESAIRFFETPNLQKKNVPKNYPELEI